MSNNSLVFLRPSLCFSGDLHIDMHLFSLNFVLGKVVEVGRLHPAGIGNDKALSVDVEELDSLMRYPFVADRMFAEYFLDLFLLVVETDHIHFLVLALDLNRDVLHLIHAGVDSIIKSPQPSLLNQSLHSPFSFSLMIHHKINSARILHIVDVLDNWVNLIEFDVEQTFLINEIYTYEDQFYPSAWLIRLSHENLGHEVDILGLNEDSHQQIRLSIVYLNKFFPGSEKDIPSFVKVGLVAEIEIPHIIPRIKDILVEHISKHILLPPQPHVLHLQQNPVKVNPSLTIVNNRNPLMPVVLVHQK